jgi:rfaE bifunctional protein kinase chain/domain
MSQEDPIVVSTPISSTRFMGGAGIVAAHCKALGAKVNFVSLTGDDELATWAQNYMDEVGVETRLIRDSNRPTVVKQRFKSANQTLFRLTHFRSEEADKALMEKLIESTLSLVDKSNILIFSDFVFGTLHPYVVSKINEVARNNGNIFIAADSQSSSQVGALFKFREIDLVTPTEHEARLELRNEVDGVAVLTQQIARELNANSVILKLGADGVLLGGFINGREVSTTEAIPSANLQAIDPSGAGDSLLAASTLAMSCAQNLQESAFLGSLAAGIQVSRRGNIPIKVSDFENVIGRIFL